MSIIRIGMIGTGGISQVHGRQLLELEEVEITALSDTSTENREKFATKFGLEAVKHFTDYKAMLDECELDAVVICSPHTLHFEQATDALNKGLHVLIEKPMTCSSEEAELLIATA